MKIDKEILDNFTWSYSRVHSWQSGCRYGWWITYVLPQILKRSLPENVYHFVRHNISQDSNFFSDYGSLIHDLLDSYGKGNIDLFSLLDEYENQYEDAVQHEAPPNKFCDLASLYKEQGEKYFSEFDGFSGYEILFTEKAIKFQTKYGRNFVGFIDMGLKRISDGALFLIDHKSKKKWKSKAELKEYFRQQYIYSKSFKDIFGQYPDYLGFNRFRAQDKDIIPFTTKGLEEAEEWVESTIQDIYNATEFPMIGNNEDFFCGELCGWRNKCNWKQMQEHQKEKIQNEDKGD